MAPLLEASGLAKHYDVQTGGLFRRTGTALRAVDGVDLTIARGETLGLVGESGCGKSILGRLLIRLVPATAGRVVFDGQDLTSLRPKALRAARRGMQIIFQDPFGALNPRMAVEETITEPLLIHGGRRDAATSEAVRRMLDKVGLPRSARYRFPHEFSGGQRQRIGIARALAVEPELIICDEPVSALDVSVQAQIINLLQDLQQQRGIAYLFIAHDLAVVEHISQRVMVMYLGKIVETAEAKTLLRSPLHPYTQALISAVPEVDPETKRQRIVLPGDVPSPIHPPPGCPFHPRCPIAEARCQAEIPLLREISSGHRTACHLAK